MLKKKERLERWADAEKKECGYREREQAVDWERYGKVKNDTEILREIGTAFQKRGQVPSEKGSDV